MTRRTQSRGLGLAAWALLTAVQAAWPSAAAAHEVGTTSVTATVDGRRYAVELTIDAGALLAKLDAEAGRPRTRPLAPGEYRHTLAGRADEILQHVSVLFDDQPASARLESITDIPTDDPIAPARVCLRVAGDVPRGAHVFRWSYGLAFASYGFVVKRAGSPDGRLEWLEGGESSRPFEVGPPSLGVLNGAAVLQPVPVLLLGCAALMTGLALRKLPRNRDAARQL